MRQVQIGDVLVDWTADRADGAFGVWYADGSTRTGKGRVAWEAIPRKGVICVVQRWAGGHYPAAGDYYYMDEVGQIQNYVGGGPSLKAMFEAIGEMRELDKIPTVKAGQTIPTTQFNELQKSAQMYVYGDCGCGN